MARTAARSPRLRVARRRQAVVRSAEPAQPWEEDLSWTTYVGSGALVTRDEALLLIRQRRHYGVHWECPGGYCEAGESLEEAARREVREEAGIDVMIGDLICTLVWERGQDRRRNVLGYFAARPIDEHAEPTPQIEEDIDAAAFLDPGAVTRDIHPLEQVVIDHWWPRREVGFHIHADVLVRPDGTQDYRFR